MSQTRAVAADHQRGAFGDAGGDIAFNAIQRVAGDDRTHFGIELHAVLDLQRAGALRQ